MLVMRPVQLDDLDQLVELAAMTSFGLTSLPKDRELLRKKIIFSQRSFEHTPDRPGAESYLFVMEDTETGTLAGTSGIMAKTGGFEPFYAYRIETETFESDQINVRTNIRTLHLVTEHDGPAEVCSLFLRPSYRLGGNGRLLSLSRFLFMAEFANHFDPSVIAEMRGVIDERGHSDFWDAVGRHFFEIDFPDADYLSIVDKKFIADLMPRHPVYVNLLPAAAQAVIGNVHDRTRPALRMLEGEGFRFANLVDIFEAGPMVGCPLKEIRAVRESIRATVAELTSNQDEGADPAQHVIGNTQRDFRACLGTVDPITSETVRISEAVAEGLGIRVGDALRYVRVRPATREGDK